MEQNLYTIRVEVESVGLSALRVSVLRAAVGPVTLAENARVVFRSCSVQSPGSHSGAGSVAPASRVALPVRCFSPGVLGRVGSGGGGGDVSPPLSSVSLTPPRTRAGGGWA